MFERMGDASQRILDEFERVTSDAGTGSLEGEAADAFRDIVDKVADSLGDLPDVCDDAHDALADHLLAARRPAQRGGVGAGPGTHALGGPRGRRPRALSSRRSSHGQATADLDSLPPAGSRPGGRRRPHGGGGRRRAEPAAARRGARAPLDSAGRTTCAPAARSGATCAATRTSSTTAPPTASTTSASATCPTRAGGSRSSARPFELVMDLIGLDALLDLVAGDRQRRLGGGAVGAARAARPRADDPRRDRPVHTARTARAGPGGDQDGDQPRPLRDASGRARRPARRSAWSTWPWTAPTCWVPPATSSSPGARRPRSTRRLRHPERRRPPRPPSNAVPRTASSGGDLPEITVSRGRHPESAQHVEDAQSAGHPTELTIDRQGATQRRRESMRGNPRQPGLDRDEYPPAMFQEGGTGSSVRGIDPSDNRGAGSSMGHQARDHPDGTRVRLVVSD